MESLPLKKKRAQGRGNTGSDGGEPINSGPSGSGSEALKRGKAGTGGETIKTGKDGSGSTSVSTKGTKKPGKVVKK